MMTTEQYRKLLVLERQNLSSSLKLEPFLALDIAPGLRRRGWKYFCRFVSLFVLLSSTDFMNKPKFIDPSGILKIVFASKGLAGREKIYRLRTTYNLDIVWHEICFLCA